MGPKVITLLLAALVAMVSSAMVSSSEVFPKGWVDLYRAPYSNNPGTMMSIACLESNLCYAPAASNGVGVQIFKFDGNYNAPWSPMQIDAVGMEIMILALGAGGTAEAPHGIAGGPDIFGGLLYLKNSTTWTSPLALPFTATTSVWVDKKTGLRIVFPDDLATTSTIWLSNDGGFTFSSKNVSAPLPTSNCTFARYISQPTDDVIYMTFGNFPNSSKSSRGSDAYVTEREAATMVKRNERSEVHIDSHRKSVRHVRNSAIEQRLQAKGTFGSSSSSSSSSGGGDQCGYSAAILKSTDGGNTWRTLLQSADEWYPNEIACSNATHCVFVGGGQDTGIVAYVTTNGGETFEATLRVPNTDSEVRFLQTVAISPANPNIVLVAGGKQTSAGGDEGLFYGSEDGGMTWVEHQNVNFIAEVMQISFSMDGTAAFAAAETLFQAATILRFNPNGPPLTPAPAFNGNFTQKVCNQSSPCTSGCTVTSLPQNTCLQMNGGGSLINSCDMLDQVLVQKVFILSDSCEGPAEEQVAPLGVCLDGQGNSLEFFCGPRTSDKDDVAIVPARGYKATGVRKA